MGTPASETDDHGNAHGDPPRGRGRRAPASASSRHNLTAIRRKFQILHVRFATLLRHSGASRNPFFVLATLSNWKKISAPTTMDDSQILLLALRPFAALMFAPGVLPSQLRPLKNFEIRKRH
jgi:hypothetical protein